MNELNIFLDDERHPTDVTWITLPKKEWTIVRNYEEFVTMIKANYVPTFISYDHDLADQHYKTQRSYFLYTEKTGYHCAKWMVKYCMKKKIKHPDFSVHSMNPIGAENIKSYIKNYNESLE
jgi:hypothetical protein